MIGINRAVERAVGVDKHTVTRPSEIHEDSTDGCIRRPHADCITITIVIHENILVICDEYTVRHYYTVGDRPYRRRIHHGKLKNSASRRSGSIECVHRVDENSARARSKSGAVGECDGIGIP